MSGDKVHRCPNCGAVVSASRFARVAECSFCGATVHLDDGVVSVARFREAHRAWLAPDPALAANAVLIDGDAWTRLAAIAAGEVSDVFAVERQRYPGERALLKVLRDAADLPLFEQEWRALTRLAASDARGAEVLSRRLPQPIRLSPPQSGAPARMLLGWAPGFERTFEEVARALPAGVPPRAAVWMWRRILESLAFVHASGLVHGAVLPQHLLVERGEHGVRLVGFSCAAAPGAPLAALDLGYERLYPRDLVDSGRLETRHDVIMSARAIALVLGADHGGRLPAAVPSPFAALIGDAAAGRGGLDAWALREHIETVSHQIFGPPSFCPLDIA